MIQPLSLIVASYTLIAVAVHLRNGQYAPTALALILGALAVLIWAGRRVVRAPGWTNPASADRVLAGAVMVLAIAGLARRPIVEAVVGWFTPAAKGLCVVVIGYVLARSSNHPVLRRLRRPAFWAIIVTAFALRALVVVASPHPRIDVYVASQESAAHLAAGQNPYSTPVSDPYNGQGFGYEIRSYMYPPGTLYLQLAGYALGDVRLASVIAEAVVVCVLIAMLGGWRVPGNDSGSRLAEFVPLLFLMQPRGFFVIEKAWTEPLILGSLSLALWFVSRQRRTLAAGVYGLMLSLKQSLLFFAPLGLLVERRPFYLGVATVVAAATIVPFWLWDRQSLMDNALLFHFDTGFRSETLTIWAPLSQMLSINPSRWWTIGVGLVATLAALFAFRRLEPIRGFLWAASVSTLAMFVLGDKAWCNYYYWVCGLLALLAARESRAHD